MWSLLWPMVCAGCAREEAGLLCPACTPTTLVPVTLPIDGVSRAAALGAYDGPLGAAVRRAKFRPDRALTCALARALARAAPAMAPVDLVVPAPSTLRSRVTRGFATASVLAAPLARALEVPCGQPLHLARGPRQSASSGSARRHNLVGRLRAVQPVSGRVLLVDDVVTTGATAAACARELLGAGARSVHLLAVCATDVQIP